MIDKLDLRINSPFDLPRFENELINHSTRKLRVRDAYFGYSTVYFRENETLLTLKHMPINSSKTFAQIESNPSHFSGIDEYLALIIPSDVKNEETELKRIDYAVDINVSVRTLFEKCRARGKHLYEDHFDRLGRKFKRDQFSGFYFGDKPELIVCYDKAYRLANRYKFKPKAIKGENVGLRSRIEVRQSNKKLPITHIGDLRNLTQINPFKCFEIYEFLDTDKGRYLKGLSKIHGFHLTRCQLNESNNFNRMYSKAIEESPLRLSLLNQYQSELKSFFDNKYMEKENYA